MTDSRERQVDLYTFSHVTRPNEFNEILDFRLEHYSGAKDYLLSRDSSVHRALDRFDHFSYHFACRDERGRLSAAVRCTVPDGLGWELADLVSEIPAGIGKDHLEISRLLVSEEARGKSVAEAFLGCVNRWIVDNSPFHKFFAVGSVAASRFYRRLGIRVLRTEPLALRGRGKNEYTIVRGDAATIAQRLQPLFGEHPSRVGPIRFDCPPPCAGEKMRTLITPVGDGLYRLSSMDVSKRSSRHVYAALGDAALELVLPDCQNWADDFLPHVLRLAEGRTIRSVTLLSRSGEAKHIAPLLRRFPDAMVSGTLAGEPYPRAVRVLEHYQHEAGGSLFEVLHGASFSCAYHPRSKSLITDTFGAQPRDTSLDYANRIVALAVEHTLANATAAAVQTALQLLSRLPCSQILTGTGRGLNAHATSYFLPLLRARTKHRPSELTVRPAVA